MTQNTYSPTILKNFEGKKIAFVGDHTEKRRDGIITDIFIADNCEIRAVILWDNDEVTQIVNGKQDILCDGGVGIFPLTSLLCKARFAIT